MEGQTILICRENNLGDKTFHLEKDEFKMNSRWDVVHISRRMIGITLAAILPVSCGGAGHQLYSWGKTDWMTADKPNIVAIPQLDLGSWAGAYLAGHHALHVYDLSSASAYYSRVLQKDLSNPALLKRMCILLAEHGNFEDSIAFAERLLSLQSEDVLVNMILAVKAAKDGKYSEVEHLAKSCSFGNANEFIVPLMIAWAQAGQGQIDAALITVSSLRTIGQLSALYDFHSGMINDLANRRVAATAHYEAAMSAEGSLSLRTLEIIGGFYARSGQYQKAQSLRERYAKEHPTTVLVDSFSYLNRRITGSQVTSPIIITVHAGLAEALFDAANTIRTDYTADLSLLFVRLALSIRGDFSLAQMLLGDILQAKSRYKEAMDAYSAIDRESFVYYLAQLRIADAFYKSSNAKEAILILTKLAQKWPTYVESLVSLGDMLRNEKRFIEAISAYNDALARVQSIKPHHWSLFYSRGIAHERARQWSDAERDLLKALELCPNHPLVLNYLGYSWLEKGTNLNQAKKMIQQAVAQRPEDGYIVDSLGWALYMTNNYQEAVQTLEQAVELEPTDPAINDHLGDAYWHIGRQQEAYFQWRRALSLHPEPETDERIHQKLGRYESEDQTNIQKGVSKP